MVALCDALEKNRDGRYDYAEQESRAFLEKGWLFQNAREFALERRAENVRTNPWDGESLADLLPCGS
jgi:hypothetical protein